MGCRRRRPEPCAHDRRPPSAGIQLFYGILDHLAGHFHYPSESRDVFEYNGYASNPEWKNIKDQVPQTAYSTDLFAACAKQWIVDQRKSARKTGKPFFLYLAFPAPHGNLVVPGVPYPSGGGLKGGLQWVKKEGTESVNTAFDARAERIRIPIFIRTIPVSRMMWPNVIPP